MLSLRPIFSFGPSLAAAFLAAAFLVGCVSSGEDASLRRTSAKAHDHIMLVREQPVTFGFTRLTALAAYYPDLTEFLSQEGIPDFLAETNKGENRYLVLYYLPSRRAFACRSGSGSSRAVEFSGPYPVTESEFNTLDKLREKAAPHPFPDS